MSNFVQALLNLIANCLAPQADANAKPIYLANDQQQQQQQHQGGYHQQPAPAQPYYPPQKPAAPAQPAAGGFAGVPSVASGGVTTPTPAELADLSAACQRLWALDDNRLHPGADYVLDLQGGKKSYESHDAARGKLFASVSKAVWERPTYRIFYALLDNYVRYERK